MFDLSRAPGAQGGGQAPGGPAGTSTSSGQPGRSPQGPAGEAPRPGPRHPGPWHPRCKHGCPEHGSTPGLGGKDTALEPGHTCPREHASIDEQTRCHHATRGPSGRPPTTSVLVPVTSTSQEGGHEQMCVPFHPSGEGLPRPSRGSRFAFLLRTLCGHCIVRVTWESICQDFYSASQHQVCCMGGAEILWSPSLVTSCPPWGGGLTKVTWKLAFLPCTTVFELHVGVCSGRAGGGRRGGRGPGLCLWAAPTTFEVPPAAGALPAVPAPRVEQQRARPRAPSHLSHAANSFLAPK